MKKISIRKGLSGLLIMEAVVIAAVTAVFMFFLYRAYSRVVHSESAEVLNLYAQVAEAELSEFEALSFAILSNRDIQANLRRYIDASEPFEAHQALSSLYTQLFTRWILNPGVLAISFVFDDGVRVDAGLREVRLPDERLAELARAAAELQGSPAWTADSTRSNVVTLYRLIRDISGNNNFGPLGTLVIHADADHLLNHAPALSQRYQPEIVAVAGDRLLFRGTLGIDPAEVLRSLNGMYGRSVVRLGGEPHFVAVKKLNTGWDLVYLLPTRGLMKEIAELNLLYGAALAAVTLLAAAVGHRLAAHIHRPIARLTESMRAIEKGDYSGALNLSAPSRISEVAQLFRGYSRMVREIDRLINEVYSRQLTIMDMRYRMLRQQINPHFLYNTLDTIGWKAAQDGDEEIPAIVKALSRMLRGAIKGGDMVTVADELRFVGDYIQIQKIRFEDRLNVEVDVPERFHRCRIPHLTLQPIVENCIVHNLDKMSEPLEIRISARLAGGELRIEVSDNGRGVDRRRLQRALEEESEEGRDHIGLRNIHKRVTLSFGERFGIEVRGKQPHGSAVTVVLPFEEDRDANRAHSGR